MSSETPERMDLDDPPSDRDAQSSAPVSDDESDPEPPAELMVVSRARRSNAGNRMSTLLAKSAEEGEEEWGEEWEEAPNEEEFVGNDANDQDDFNLESSSSEEDDDGADDDEGERELRKTERQERNKRRKTAANPFAARLAAAARKRVKLDVPATEAQSSFAPRPKKKSERASWIPTPEDGPIRTSSRRQTVANKQHTMAKLKEKDRRRDDTLAMMKAAEARKAKDEPKPMSQAERMTEAARVERVNSKSLHRWEAAEEQRAADRQAKLDALKNRQIEGPFIRYYSGPAIWVDDKIKYTGKNAPKIEDLDEKLNKDIPLDVDPQAPSSMNEQSSMPAPSLVNQSTVSQDQTQILYTASGLPSVTEVELQSQPHNATPQSDPPSTQASQAPISQASAPQPQGGPLDTPQLNSIAPISARNPDSFLSGIEQYAVEQPITSAQNNATQPQTTPPRPEGPAPSHKSPVPQTQPPQMPSTQPISSPLAQGTDASLTQATEAPAMEQPQPSLTQSSQAPSTQATQTPIIQPVQGSSIHQGQAPLVQPVHESMVPSTQPPFPQTASTDPSSIPPNPFSQSPFSQPHLAMPDSQIPFNQQQSLQQLQPPPLPQVPPAPPAPPRRKVIGRALRNLIILSSFPGLDSSSILHTRLRTTSSIIKERDRTALVQLSSTLFGWSVPTATALVDQMLSAPKKRKDRERESHKLKKELCTVTNLVARYRDPATGLPYRDARAYAVLKGVVSGGFVWSGALGCYVGARMGEKQDRRGAGGMRTGTPAKGVPARFIKMGPKPEPVSSTAGDGKSTVQGEGTANAPITILDGNEQPPQAQQPQSQPQPQLQLQPQNNAAPSQDQPVKMEITPTAAT